MLSFLRNRRRNRLLAQPFSTERRSILAQRVRHYQFLPAPQQTRLEAFVQVFAAEKDWAAAGSLQITDEMKVTIAGYAGLMTLGLAEPYYFDRLKTIVIGDDVYRPRGVERNGILMRRPDPRFGEAHQAGPIKLSWREIAEHNRMRPGNNLVIHEFAHHVDGLDGHMDGTPSIVGREQQRRWREVIEAEFARLRHDASTGGPTALDPYGATNRAEFFAVASECFFERPHAMRQWHPELYQVLADFYCQDVASWLPDAAA
jgi:Mlc titration factor MtfA (ptsG expression regulator)